MNVFTTLKDKQVDDTMGGENIPLSDSENHITKYKNF